MGVSIPVLGEIYEILITDDGVPADAAACCCARDLKIILRPSLRENPDHLWRVLRHEMGHAYINESGMADYMNEREQEMAAQTLGNFMGSIFEIPAFVGDLFGEAAQDEEAAQEAQPSSPVPAL